MDFCHEVSNLHSKSYDWLFVSLLVSLILTTVLLGNEAVEMLTQSIYSAYVIISDLVAHTFCGTVDRQHCPYTWVDGTPFIVFAACLAFTGLMTINDDKVDSTQLVFGQLTVVNDLIRDILLLSCMKLYLVFYD